MMLTSKILDKIKKEIIFTKLKVKSRAHLEKRISVIGPEYMHFGNDIYIGKYYRLHNFDSYESVPKSTYNPNLVIEDGVHIADFFTILNAGNVKIGKKTLIASNVLICNLNHGSRINSNISFMEQPLETGTVHIGENCWIGEKVVILTNVTIGNNVIIGSSSVVTKSIPSNSVAVGNPARVIKQWDKDENKWKSV